MAIPENWRRVDNRWYARDAGGWSVRKNDRDGWIVYRGGVMQPEHHNAGEPWISSDLERAVEKAENAACAEELRDLAAGYDVSIIGLGRGRRRQCSTS